MMDESTRKEIIRSVLRSAIDAQPEPDGPHVVDDFNLLACWDADLLSEDDQQFIIDHLARCPRCRHEVAELAEEGILGTEETAEDDDAHESTGPKENDGRSALPMPDSAAEGRCVLLRRTGALALAASLLVAIGGIVWYLANSGSEAAVAQLEDDVRLGRYSQALNTADALLEGNLAAGQRERTQQLYEEAGYRSAEQALAAGDWDQVQNVESRVTDDVGPSSRLLNLSLQAQRKVPATSSLAYRGSLLDQGYMPSGRPLGKSSMPVEDEAAQLLHQRYSEAVDNFPDNVILRLNYGQFLSKNGDRDAAREQFLQVLVLEPKNSQAQLGLGLLEFNNRKYDRALYHFEAALESDEEPLAAVINAAVCLEKLAQPNRAREFWQRALEQPLSARVRKLVKAHLSQGFEPVNQ